MFPKPIAHRLVWTLAFLMISSTADLAYAHPAAIVAARVLKKRLLRHRITSSSSSSTGAIASGASGGAIQVYQMVKKRRQKRREKEAQAIPQGGMGTAPVQRVPEVRARTTITTAD